MVNVPERILVLFPNSRLYFDWQVEEVAGAQTISRWNAAIGAQPTEAQLAAVTPAQIAALPGQRATTGARTAKAEATAGIDNGNLPAGDKLERIVRAVALSALDAFNADRTAMAAMNSAVQAATTLADLKTRFAAISLPPQVTAAQLVTAIKAKIAATAE